MDVIKDFFHLSDWPNCSKMLRWFPNCISIPVNRTWWWFWYKCWLGDAISSSSCMQYVDNIRTTTVKPPTWINVGKLWRSATPIMIFNRTWLLWKLEACRTVFGDELTPTTTYGSWLSCHVKPQNRSEPMEIPQGFSDIGYSLSRDPKACDPFKAVSGAGWSETRLKTWDVIRSFDKQDNRP